MDYNAILRNGATAGTQTGDETLDAFTLSPMTNPVYLYAVIPNVSTGDTLDITADFQDANGNSLMQTTISQIAAAGHYWLPLFCDKLLLAKLVVTLDTTADDSNAMNFGAVDVYLRNSGYFS